MRRIVPSAVVLAGLIAAASLAGCGETTTVTRTVTVTAPPEKGLGPPKELTQFGHIISLERKGGRTLMEFDPALFLSGLTAQKAAAEDRVIEQGAPMPNDNYRVEEGDRTFTYVVAPNAEVTVLTNKGDPGQIGATPVDVAELARIVDGTSTMKLFEPLYSGVWLTIRGDRVVAIDQQYQP